MRQWRPLFKRLEEEHTDGVLHEGVPGWLKPSLFHWVSEQLQDTSGWGPSAKMLHMIQRKCRIESLSWSNGAESATHSLLQRMANDDELALEVVNLLVFYASQTDSMYRRGEVAFDLEVMLATAGSAWTVAGESEEPLRLERRVPSEVRDRYVEVSAKGRAGGHLQVAWREMYGRNPDPSAAYREAVRAVEAAGTPIISPNNSRTTLGTMIRDFRAKPDKWDVPLGSTAEQGRDVLLKMMEGVWHGQSDRHGTPDEEAPISVTPEEAEAALHAAITLVHLFWSGLVAHKRT